MRFSAGPREYDLKPGDWVLVFEDGRVAGWTEAQRLESVRWAQSGGTLPMPEIV
jgi:hypothetical protein